MKQLCRAFTIIELLIVVAIIAILAAIAIPNLLEAQTKARVARAKADLSGITTALESYFIDHNAYPPINVEVFTGAPTFVIESRHAYLTTPVAYMSSIAKDPFGDGWVDVSVLGSTAVDVKYKTYDLLTFNDPDAFETLVYKSDLVVLKGFPESMLWILASQGPDGTVGLHTAVGLVYDPSNGTVSEGDIIRTGPGGALMGG